MSNSKSVISRTPLFCKHPKMKPNYTESELEVTSRYPLSTPPPNKDKCPDCGDTVTAYSSYMHYIYSLADMI